MEINILPDEKSYSVFFCDQTDWLRNDFNLMFTNWTFRPIISNAFNQSELRLKILRHDYENDNEWINDCSKDKLLSNNFLEHYHNQPQELIFCIISCENI